MIAALFAGMIAVAVPNHADVTMVQPICVEDKDRPKPAKMPKVHYRTGGYGRF